MTAARHPRLRHFLHRPINLFANREVSGAIVMLIAAATALIWANSPWSASYYTFWHTEIELAIGNWELHHLNFEELVNEGLMVIFFFVVGLEIKRELVTGELRTFRAAAVPVFGALGGMIVPAGAYLVLNATSDAANGWGIPIATDIAFAVGVVALLGSRVNPLVKLFLLTLAIVDDIGAIIVIAVFYTDSIQFAWLLGAVIAVIVMRIARQLGVWSIPFYVVAGIVMWYAMLESGIHATIAGVVLGLLTPAKPLTTKEQAAAAISAIDHEATNKDMAQAAFLLTETKAPTENLEHHLHPLSAFVVVPLFALANAGIDIGGGALSDAATSTVAWGVFLGLVVGKPVGIVFATWLATKCGFSLPHGVHWMEFVGMGMAAGIGFTVSIFVGNLAFDADSTFGDTAKISILAASLVASLGALLFLNISHKLKQRGPAPSREVEPGTFGEEHAEELMNAQADQPEMVGGLSQLLRPNQVAWPNH